MPAGPVGGCWAPGTWADTVWELGVWGDAVVVPVVRRPGLGGTFGQPTTRFPIRPPVFPREEHAGAASTTVFVSAYGLGRKESAQGGFASLLVTLSPAIGRKHIAGSAAASLVTSPRGDGVSLDVEALLLQYWASRQRRS